MKIFSNRYWLPLLLGTALLSAACAGDKKAKPSAGRDASEPGEDEPANDQSGSTRMDSGVEARDARSDTRDAGTASARSDARVLADAGEEEEEEEEEEEGDPACPATQPKAGDACQPLADDCPYANLVCECGPENKWVCWDESADCPASQPAISAACPTVGAICEYATGDAGTGELDCECTASGWDCSGVSCPEQKPSSGGSCGRREGSCNYGAEVCECDNSAWTCWNPSDCAATPPADRSACSQDGVTCTYGNLECECERGRWGCEDESMEAAGAG